MEALVFSSTIAWFTVTVAVLVGIVAGAIVWTFSRDRRAYVRIVSPKNDNDITLRRFYPIIGILVSATIIALAIYHIKHVASAYLLAPIAIVSFVWLALNLVLAHSNPRWLGSATSQKVGIVVPAHNEDPAMLLAMLESFDQQSIQPSVVVLIENGVTEPKLQEIFEKWANRSDIPIAQYLHLSEPSKREAQIAGIEVLRAHEVDVVVTVDSDTRLDRCAIEQGLVPFADHSIASVAGLLVSENRDKNLLTRIVDIGFVASFVNGRSAWSALRSVAVNCGGLAFYRLRYVEKYLDEYASQQIAGRKMSLGDDRMLTAFASFEGATVFNEQSVGYTLMPENIGHLTRQRSRWWRSFWWGGYWLLRRQSPKRAIWWLVLSQYIAFCLYAVVLPIVLVVSPALNGRFPWAFLLYIAGLSYLRSARTLLIKRPDQTTRSQVINYLVLSPLVTLLNLWICSALQWWGLLTFRRSGWNTRQIVEVSKK